LENCFDHSYECLQKRLRIVVWLRHNLIGKTFEEGERWAKTTPYHIKDVNTGWTKNYDLKRVGVLLENNIIVDAYLRG